MVTLIGEKGKYWVKGEKKRMPMWYYKALQEAKTPEQRRTLRSKTFQGIAKAMAFQWTYEDKYCSTENDW